MTKRKETVEEFLARGGRIEYPAPRTEVPEWESTMAAAIRRHRLKTDLQNFQEEQRAKGAHSNNAAS